MEQTAHTNPSSPHKEHNRTPSLVALLQDVQRTHGYLPRDTVKAIAREHGIPLSALFAAATFYNAFSLQPQGKHIISICHGTACHVQKADNLAAAITRYLDLPDDEGTTPDMLFTLKKVRCLGCCSMAPVIKIDESVYGAATPSKATKLIGSLRKA